MRRPSIIVNGDDKDPVPGGDTPIFDALAERAPNDPLEDVALSDAVPVDDPAPERDDPSDALPPDAAARDAAKREQAASADDSSLREEHFRFATRGVSPEEKAAVIAVLTQVRAEEARRVKRVERREHQPWARSQRVPEGIGDLLAEG